MPRVIRNRHLAGIFALLLCICLSSNAHAQGPTLFNSGIYTAGGSPAVADFNGDGNMDIATDSGVVLLGNGDGTFTPGTSFRPALPTLNVLVTADFNHDGKADLAFWSGVNVTVLLGNGDGTFQPALETDVGATGAYGVLAAADLGNGTVDLITASEAGGSLWVLIGKGDGTFSSPAAYDTGAFVGALQIADFNGDGKLDVAAMTGGVTIFLGNGDGSLQAPLPPNPTTMAATCLTVGDFNGDGKLDIAVGTSLFQAPSELNIFLGNGDGTFQPAQVVGLSASFSFAYAIDIVAGSFGASGVSDLAVYDGFEVQILSNNGSGTFSLGDLFAVALGNVATPLSQTLAVADFNNDQKADLVSTYVTTASVLLGTGNSNFQGLEVFGAQSFSSPTQGPITTGDFNGDGKPDVVQLVNSPSIALAVALGNGDGTFSGFQTFPSGFVYALTTGDFNGDKKLDVAVGGAGTGVAIQFGNGDGTFQSGPALATTGGEFLTAADLTGSGKLDLVSYTPQNGGNVVVLLGNGDGTFQPAVSYCCGAFATSLSIADWSGDGKLDIITVSRGGIGVLLGNGDGTFAATSFESFPNISPDVLATGDFNNDGIVDLAIANPTYTDVYILLGTGGGNFSLKATYPFSTYTLAVQDMNGDGNPDLVLNYRNIGLALGNGDGTFTAAGDFQVASFNQNLAFADFNLDGRLDIAAGANPGFVTLLNRGAIAFTLGPASGQSTSATVNSGKSASFNLQVTPAGGFSGSVDLTCSITPVVSPAPVCSLPSSVKVSGTSAAPFTVTVTTTAPQSASLLGRHNFWPGLWATAMIGIVAIPKARRRTLVRRLGILSLLLATLCGCGGGGGNGGGSTSPTGGTPPGTYTVAVKAIAGSIAQSLSLTVTVQ
jgi:hypothetical protein